MTQVLKLKIWTSLRKVPNSARAEIASQSFLLFMQENILLITSTFSREHSKAFPQLFPAQRRRRWFLQSLCRDLWGQNFLHVSKCLWSGKVMKPARGGKFYWKTSRSFFEILLRVIRTFSKQKFLDSTKTFIRRVLLNVLKAPNRGYFRFWF